VGPPQVPERRHIALLEERPLFSAAVFALVTLTLGAQLARTAPPDMAFLLYAAGRVLDGAKLYRDVVEINPPLIVWLNIPIVLLARATHLSEFLVYRLASGAAVGALFSLCYRVMRWYAFPDQPAYGRYCLLLLCFALFPLAAEDLGQREHFVLALLAPYILLVTARLRGREPPFGEALGLGILAGIAIALKPHFALAWLALEAFRLTRGSARLTPELIGTVVFLVAYAATVILIAPEFLTMASALGPLYLRYLHAPFYSLFVLAPGALLVLVALLAAAVLRRSSRHPVLWALLAAEVVACFLSGAAQQKGLRYHFYPSFALAFVLLGLVAVDVPANAARLSTRLYGRVARVLTATIVVVVLGTAIVDAAGGSPADRRARAQSEDLAEFVRAHADGRPVAVLSYHIAGAFPLVNYAGVSLASRFPHLWLLPASYWDSLEVAAPLVYHTVAQMRPPERYLWDAVHQDLLQAQPGLILVLRPARDVAPNGLRRLHYIRYFERDPDLAALFSRYQLLATKGEYDVYERLRNHAARIGPPPSSELGQLDVLRPQLREVRLEIIDPAFLAGLLVFAAIWCISLVAKRRETSACVPATAK
jgi:hypothetical protein